MIRSFFSSQHLNWVIKWGRRNSVFISCLTETVVERIHSSQNEHLYNGSSFSYSVLCLSWYVYLFSFIYFLLKILPRNIFFFIFSCCLWKCHQTRTNICRSMRMVQVLHYPVVFLHLEVQIISTGTISMEDQNLNFLYSPTVMQKMLSGLLKIQDSLLTFQKGNMWIWRSPLLLYQTLLCTTVLWRPQWQETHQLSTKTCYCKRRAKHRDRDEWNLCAMWKVFITLNYSYIKPLWSCSLIINFVIQKTVKQQNISNDSHVQ